MPGRGYAYAAVADYAANNDEYIPFDQPGLPFSPSGSSGYPWAPDRGLANLPTFDPTSPLVIHDSLRPGPRKFRDHFAEGSGGDIQEIHQTLQACLQVGRLERAAATLRRLSSIYRLDAPELINTHNDYLVSLIDRVVNTKDQELLKQVQHWFEVEIRAQGIPPDALTYGLMLRASFQEANQLKIDRTIRRYIALAEQAGLRDEALCTALTTLNAQEIGRVTRACPTRFYEASELSVDDNFQLLPTEADIEAPTEGNLREVRAQQQKGLGLIALQKSLSVFSRTSQTSHRNRDNTSDEAEKRALAYERQQSLERDTWTSALERWQAEHEESMKRMGIHAGLQSKPISAVMWTWHEALVPLIREEIKKANETESRKNRSDHGLIAYGPFLQFISPEKMSAVTIIQTLNKISTCGVDRGTKVVSLVSTIGQAIQDESLAESLKGPKSRYPVSAHTQQKKLVQLLRRRKGYDKDAQPPDTKKDNAKSDTESAPSTSLAAGQSWPPAIRAQLGAVLISLLIQAAKLEVSREDPESGDVSKEVQSVFWNSFQYQNGKRYGVIRLNAAMSNKLRKEPVKHALSKYLPMLVEPLPWSQYKKGGFLKSGIPVVRGGTQHTQLRDYIRAAAESGDMTRVFAGLDVLGRTPWQINKGVFDVMLQVWNSGEGLGKVPPESPKFEYPPEPGLSADLKERRTHAFRIREIENERDGLHSTRCFLNFQLEVARAYLGETFYFPHNVDFRGRAYPIPPYLNHMGADNCRGLLLFGKGKELGESGLAWLKVHLANVFGYDKASFKERQDFTTDHIKDIYDSVNNPLGGSRWWLTAEDPWQCLATCMELKNALDSPEPTKFVSHLPVHQDGTCNGLQHYAALGGDPIGAKQVNLEPGNRPSDIYTAVADVVQREVAKDAANGDPLAKQVEGKISRKVVKPTVMTNVYGVTMSGAKRQVASQLRDLYLAEFTGDPHNLAIVSTYVTKKIFGALSAMFNGAHDIQYWLGECASRICDALTPEQMEWIEANAAGKPETSSFARKATNETKLKDEHMRFKSSVIWTTPLKMPVVQPYRTATSRVVKTNLQLISLNEPSASDPVSKRKQLQGFPPNFIHSLDATHMLLSALKCDELGLSFAAVHDSFWTHAADLDIMNGVIRDSFITMHSEDIIGRLAAEFAARYKNYMYLAQVKSNSPLGKRITALRMKEDRKFKAHGQIKEMLQEKLRITLLASENPEERAEGEAMVTPAKLFEETADENDLVTLEEMQGLDGVIGEAPKANSDDTEAKSIVFEPDHDSFDTLQPVLNLVKPFAERDILLDDTSSTEPSDDSKDRQAVINKRARITRTVRFWMPMSFPAVPKKGSFEVSRLKDSKYFFS
ncbi:DNA-directed RNA polymerase [Trapelia coarctata]|nr:DNA-directed RNA polymerase [Trapelia coarctata]